VSDPPTKGRFRGTFFSSPVMLDFGKKIAAWLQWVKDHFPCYGITAEKQAKSARFFRCSCRKTGRKCPTFKMRKSGPARTSGPLDPASAWRWVESGSVRAGFGDDEGSRRGAEARRRPGCSWQSRADASIEVARGDYQPGMLCASAPLREIQSSRATPKTRMPTLERQALNLVRYNRRIDLLCFPGEGRGPVGKAVSTTCSQDHSRPPDWTPAFAGEAQKGSRARLSRI